MSSIHPLALSGGSALTLIGIDETVQGALRVGSGNLVQGTKKLAWGMYMTSLGGFLSGLRECMRQDLVKATLVGGLIAVGCEGIHHVAEGIKTHNLFQAVKGSAQLVMATAASTYVANLPAKTIEVIHQATSCATISAFIAYSGIQDIAKGHCLKGAIKTCLGVSGILSSGHYVYTQLNNGWIPSDQLQQLPEPVATFLKEREDELQYMQETKKTAGKWTKMGEGISKITLEHPQLPDYVIKIPYKEDFDGTLLTHCTNSLYAKKTVETYYPNLVVPDCYLLKTKDVRLLAESKLYISSTEATETSRRELRHFLSRTGFYDIRIDHNAGVLQGTEHHQKIGIYDFDHKERREVDFEPHAGFL